ncbi:hypothetical protein DQ238_13000 [Geodermatophilus sp. TF02-6]|uniref:plasmid mobilization protein n=1 Tax=Geodermatophilus sp. TF02-6 TaxID=2250575 RepID=UPI000DEACE41|nr:hypothetical protein [Geodermatophilus sp. TF02-6]RBY78118.1 hypothetical protein DQ238_13000 [Geodermatophilus sp. TF02-6]
MTEPGTDATDAELAEYYEAHHADEQWGEPTPLPADRTSARLDVTISVRFTAAEIAAIRARAEAAGLKPTTYIRRCALADERPPLDRGQLSRLVDNLSRDLDDLRKATG